MVAPRFASKDNDACAKQPLFMVEGVYNDTVLPHTPEEERKSGGRLWGLAAVLFCLGVLIILATFGARASEQLWQTESPHRLLTRSRPFTVRSTQLRHNGTLEDTGEKFLLFNFPIELLVLSSHPEGVLRRVAVESFRNTHSVGRRSDLLGLPVQDRLQTVKATATVFLKGEPAQLCSLPAASFVLVDTFVTVQVRHPSGESSYVSGQQKYVVCCSMRELCHQHGVATKFVV